MQYTAIQSPGNYKEDNTALQDVSHLIVKISSRGQFKKSRLKKDTTFEQEPVQCFPHNFEKLSVSLLRKENNSRSSLQ